MKRILNAIKKYLVKDPVYFFTYIFRNIQKKYKVKCMFFDDSELSEKLIEGKSLLRIGDGEIAIVHFLGIGYQAYNNQLRQEYVDAIKNYNENSKYLIGLPIFVNYSNIDLDNLGSNKKRLWLPLKITFDLMFNKKAKYVDAHIFYRDGKFEKIIMPLIKNKNVILVTNDRNISDIKNHIFNNHIYKYISCPEKNSHEIRDSLIKEISSDIITSNKKSKDFLVLLSMGPAKTIAVELSEMGIQTIDIGVGIESYIRNFEIESRI